MKAVGGRARWGRRLGAFIGTAVITLGSVLVGTLGVGSPAGAGAALAPRLTTTWSQIPAATPTGWSPAAVGGFFVNASCVTATNCWTSGVTGNSNNTPVVEHYNGSQWSNSSLGTTGTFKANGINCPAANDCWIAGGTAYNGVSEVMLDHYNGTKWTLSSPGNRSGYLASVACKGTKWCMAVGWSVSSSTTTTKAIAEMWNGTKWAAVSAPSSSKARTTLYEVSCASTSSCFALGEQWATDGGPTSLFAERWVAGKWVAIPIPDPTVTGDKLVIVPNDLSCTGSECLAGGFYHPILQGRYPEYPLVEHWNGTAWKLVTLSSTVKSHLNWIGDVSCISTSACWLVGAGYASNTGDAAAVAHWNGTSVTMGTAVRPGLNSRLNAVACVAKADCVAIGTKNSSTGAVSGLGERVPAG